MENFPTHADKITRQVAGADIARLLNKEQVSHQANVSLRTVDQWMKDKKIPFIKIGRSVRFRWNAVEAALLKYERKAISI